MMPIKLANHYFSHVRVSYLHCSGILMCLFMSAVIDQHALTSTSCGPLVSLVVQVERKELFLFSPPRITFSIMIYPFFKNWVSFIKKNQSQDSTLLFYIVLWKPHFPRICLFYIPKLMQLREREQKFELIFLWITDTQNCNLALLKSQGFFSRSRLTTHGRLTVNPLK